MFYRSVVLLQALTRLIFSFLSHGMEARLVPVRLFHHAEQALLVVDVELAIDVPYVDLRSALGNVGLGTTRTEKTKSDSH